MAPTGTVDQIQSSLNDAFDSAREAVDKIVEKFQEIEDDTGWERVIILGPVAAKIIRDKVDDLKEAKEKFVEMFDDALPHKLPVLSLMVQSFAWIDNVKTPISGLSPQVSTWRDENLAYWSGGAGLSYRTNKVVAQKNAIDDVAVKAESISDWLFTIAQRNVEYMVEFADWAAKVAGNYVQCAIEAGSLIAVLEAVSTAADVVGDAVTQMIEQLTNTVERFVEAVGDDRQIHSVMGDHTNLPGGKWPEAVTG
ncbi:hypothetical protein ACPZ19_19240 [Amycolatopsis lurida]